MPVSVVCTGDSQAVVAWLRGGRAQRSLKETDVRLLVVPNLLEASADPVGETGIHERLCVELVKRPRIKTFFKVLQRQRVLQDVGVCGTGVNTLCGSIHSKCQRYLPLGAGGVGAERATEEAPAMARRSVLECILSSWRWA